MGVLSRGRNPRADVQKIGDVGIVLANLMAEVSRDLSVDHASFYQGTAGKNAGKE